MTAPLPPNEAERLAALREYHILDTPPEATFDDLVNLAVQNCGTPMAAVTFIDEHRQWLKAVKGMSRGETSRDVAFCAHTILQPGVMIVPDATQDDRFRGNPSVTGEPHIRFYAGAPLIDEHGYALGSLCVIDEISRNLTPEQEATLRLLARQAVSQIEAGRALVEREHLVAEKERMLLEHEQLSAEREQAESQLGAEREFSQALLESLQESIIACDADGALTIFNHAACELHRLPTGSLPSERWAENYALYEADTMTPLHADDHPLYRALRGETIRDVQILFAPSFGLARLLLATGQPIYSASGEKLGAVIAMRDVTERRQAKREHNIAQQLQTALQPVLPQQVGNLTIGSFTRSALEESEVGGDFYDLFALNKEQYAIVIGDVSGKGLAAAAQLALVRNSLRMTLYLHRTPAAAVTALNGILTAQRLLVGFVTAFVGVYDVKTGLLTYASCGHEPGLVRRALNGEVEELGATGLPLGTSEDAVYDENTVSLTAGDTLLALHGRYLRSRSKQTGPAGNGRPDNSVENTAARS